MKKFFAGLGRKIYNNPSVTGPAAAMTGAIILDVIDWINVNSGEWGAFGGLIAASTAFVWSVVSPAYGKK